MVSGNPSHRCTRAVRLPPAWPDDVQVNYYNYLAKRLIYSTDVYLGERLVYRTNAIGCRGDDLEPGRPVIGFFGDDFVHGDFGGGFVEEVAIGDCRSLNCGIEDLPLKSMVDRVLEVHAAAPMVCAVVAPPWRELTPELARVTGTDGPWEGDWMVELDRLAGPPILAFLRPPAAAPARPGEDTPALKARFEVFLQDYCRRRGTLLISADAPAPSGLTKLLGRLSGRQPSQPKSALAALIEARLSKPILDYLAANPLPAPQAVAPEAAGDQGAHGPEDAGRVYPLW